MRVLFKEGVKLAIDKSLKLHLYRCILLNTFEAKFVALVYPTLETVLVNEYGKSVYNLKALRSMSDDELFERYYCIFWNFSSDFPTNLEGFIILLNQVIRERKLDLQERLIKRFYKTQVRSNAQAQAQAWPQSDINNICKRL
jgi:hypothetical protein